jgi:hypothetical protein
MFCNGARLPHAVNPLPTKWSHGAKGRQRFSTPVDGALRWSLELFGRRNPYGGTWTQRFSTPVDGAFRGAWSYSDGETRMGVTGPNGFLRPLMELFVEPGAIRTAKPVWG